MNPILGHQQKILKNSISKGRNNQQKDRQTLHSALAEEHTAIKHGTHARVLFMEQSVPNGQVNILSEENLIIPNYFHRRHPILVVPTQYSVHYQ